MPQQRSNVVLNEDAESEVYDALQDIENLSSYDASKAGVACDKLASVLIDVLLRGKDNPFRGRAPELYEVLEFLEDSIGLPPAAVEAANEIWSALEDAYDLEENEGVAETVKEYADVVSAELMKFFKIEDNGI
jgi:hypothetical protein